MKPSERSQRLSLPPSPWAMLRSRHSFSRSRKPKRRCSARRNSSSPPREPFETRAKSRQIYAGQRVYRLRPVFDPTIERDHTSGRPSVASAKRLRHCHQIPQQYLNPLQFKYSREEVLYDMQGVLGTLPPQAHALTRWLCHLPASLAEGLSLRARKQQAAQEMACDAWREESGSTTVDGDTAARFLLPSHGAPLGRRDPYSGGIRSAAHVPRMGNLLAAERAMTAARQQWVESQALENGACEVYLPIVL